MLTRLIRGRYNMESKNIIIIFLVIIVILAAAIGITVLHPFDTKEPSKVKITSNKTLVEGSALTFKLTDLNKTPISDEIVNITVTDSKGKVVFDNVVKTDSKGKAKVDLDLKKGKYNVTVSFGGNNNYTSSNDTQKLTVKEKNVESEPASQSNQAQSSSNDDNYYNGYSRSSFSEGEQAAIDEARANGYNSPAEYYQATGKQAGQEYMDSHPEYNNRR